MTILRILICGGGIAGPTAAFWLAKAGHRCVIVERSPNLRVAGQTIDIRGSGLEVVRSMGIFDTIHSETTKETGLAFVDKDDERFAMFPMDSSSQTSFTAEIEIPRGRLVAVLYEATKDVAEYRFGDHVVGIEQLGHKVEATFHSGARDTFDLIIGADGMTSKTRSIAFPDTPNPVHTLGLYACYFNMEMGEGDGSVARWYAAGGGRVAFLRPDGRGRTAAFMGIMPQSNAALLRRFEVHAQLSVPDQRNLWKEAFAGAGWQTERILRGMDLAPDFYMQNVAQVKMDTWTKGRVTLLGDAGYCPSPISGVGTTIAIVGARALAGEISRNPDDVPAALEAYESYIRPYVKSCQFLPPGVPRVVYPQTWGGGVFRVLVAAAARIAASRLATFAGWLMRKLTGPPGAKGRDKSDFDLSRYD